MPGARRRSTASSPNRACRCCAGLGSTSSGSGHLSRARTGLWTTCSFARSNRTRPARRRKRGFTGRANGGAVRARRSSAGSRAITPWCSAWRRMRSTLCALPPCDAAEFLSRPGQEAVAYRPDSTIWRGRPGRRTGVRQLSWTRNPQESQSGNRLMARVAGDSTTRTPRRASWFFSWPVAVEDGDASRGADLSAHASCRAYADRAMRVVERLLRLWTEPLPPPAEAVAAFREAYTDPVSVNGVDMSVAALVERARAAQRAFADLRMELIEEIEAPGRVVIVFWQRGRHVGPLEMPLGEISPTGR